MVDINKTNYNIADTNQKSALYISAIWCFRLVQRPIAALLFMPGFSYSE